MLVQLPSDSTLPLYRQVYEALRSDIIKGKLSAQQKLAATRELAQQLNVSRNTVNTAYEMLQAEGYIEAKVGSGYYVCAAVDVDFQPRSVTRQSARIRPSKTLSERGQVIAKFSRPVPREDNPAFKPGFPDLDAFPFKQWNHCAQLAMHNPKHDLLSYQDQGGLQQLKQALRDYLTLSRGVHCSAEQIIIVNGSQAGLDLVSRMLINQGESIALEDPGYLGARDGFLAAGANLVPVPIDSEGLQVNVLADAANNTNIKLVYTSPSYQFPTGVTMSLARRMALLQWADEQDSFIIEDDYDSELRYSGRPLSCLQGLDQQQRVIYMGTFSKVIFPGLRMGYLVVPEDLAGAFAQALRKTGQDAPLMLQAAVAEFIQQGYFASHLRKMRKLYGEKQQRLIELAREHLSEWLIIKATEAGMQLALPFRRQRGTNSIDEEKLQTLARANRIVLTSLSRYYMGKSSRRGLYLGYASIPINKLKQNVMALKKCLQGAAR